MTIALFVVMLFVLPRLLPLKPGPPGLYGLLTQKSRQRGQLLVFIEFLQRIVVRPPVLLVDDDGRVIPEQKEIIHQ